MVENKEKINNHTIFKILIVFITAVSLISFGVVFQKIAKMAAHNNYGCGIASMTPSEREECAKHYEIINMEADKAEKFLEDYSLVFGVIGIICLIANIVIFVIVRKKQIIFKNIYTYLEGISFAASVFLSLAIF